MSENELGPLDPVPAGDFGKGAQLAPSFVLLSFEAGLPENIEQIAQRLSFAH